MGRSRSALDHDQLLRRRTELLVDALLGLIVAVVILLLGPGLGLIAVIALALVALVAVSVAMGGLRRAWRARRQDRDASPLG